MKKLISVILALVLIVSCLPLTAAAKSLSVKDKLKLLIDDMDYNRAEYFDEVYYNEIASTDSWVLFYGGLNLREVPDTPWDYPYGVFGNKIIAQEQSERCFPFKLNMGVYDKKNNAFYDLVDAWDMSFEGLHEKLNAIDTPMYGRGIYMIGDADHDGNVTILDATRIQRIIAGLDEDDYFGSFQTCLRGFQGSLLDYDRDGGLSILDATKIQRKIAELPNNIDYKTEFNIRCEYETILNKAVLVRSAKEFRDAYYHYVIENSPLDGHDTSVYEKYNDEFFRTRSLLLAYVYLPTLGHTLTTKSLVLGDDEKLTLTVDVSNPDAGPTAIDPRLICLSIFNGYLNDVSSAEVTMTSDEIIEPSIVLDEKVYDTNNTTEAAILNDTKQLKAFASKYSFNRIPAKFNDEYFEKRTLIGAYVLLGSGSLTLSLKGLSYHINNVIKLELVASSEYSYVTDDMNPRFVLIETGKDLTYKSVDVELSYDFPEEPDWYNVNTVDNKAATAMPADAEAEGYKKIDYENTLSGYEIDATLFPILSEEYAEEYKNDLDWNETGVLGVVRNMYGLSHFLPQKTGYKDKYDYKFFIDNALVVSVMLFENYGYHTGLSNIAVKGDTLYAEYDIDAPMEISPAGAVYYTVTEVKKSDVESVKKTALWKNEHNGSIVKEIPYYDQITATAPDDLNSGGYQEVAGEKITISDPGKYNYWLDYPLEDINTGYVMLIRSREDFEYYLPAFDKEGALDDEFFKDNAVIAMLQYGGADEAYAVLSDIAVSQDGTLWCSPMIFFDYKYIDGEAVVSPTDPVVWTFVKIKQSDVKDVKAIAFWKSNSSTCFETLITDDKKVAEGSYGDALPYNSLSTSTRVFTWDYQKYGDGSGFLNQPYRVAIIRSYAQYEAFFSSDNFEGINEYTSKPVYRTINGSQYPLDDVFFQDNALIVGVGYFCTGDEYLSFDEIRQSDDGEVLTVRFNRYTYGDLHPYEAYAANILGYCFAAASVPKDTVKYINAVQMLPQVKKLPDDVYTHLDYGVLDSQDELYYNYNGIFNNGFSEKDEAVYIDSADKLKSSIDRLLVDYLGNPYDRGGMRFPVETDAEYDDAWFETHGMIAARVYRGGSSTLQYVTDLERSAAGNLLLEVTLMHNGFDTPDNAWSFIFLGVEKQEGDPTVTIVTWHEEILPEPAKPIIYLYPEEETELTVTLGKPEELTCTYPAYNDGWHVTAKPDGTLIDDTGRSYYSLYWESKSKTPVRMTDGFVVKGEDTAKFFEEKLATLGLTEREAQEFIVYWLPQMQDNEYNLIRFATAEEIEEIMPLSFSVQPDSVIRVLMEYTPLDEYIDVPEQELPPAPERTGFTAVEWGGTRIG